MWPIGTYKGFSLKIKGRGRAHQKVDYFGILFCDVRQAKAREYILNYLDVFHHRSGKLIDFYIPGYISQTEIYGTNQVSHEAIYIDKEKYIFCSDTYNEFCAAFEKDFDIAFPFSPRLVIMEYRLGNFSSARKIVFELEDTDKGIKSAGALFLEIFKCAEKDEMGATIDDLSETLSKKDWAKMAGAGGISVLNFFGIDIEPVVTQWQNVLRFKVR